MKALVVEDNPVNQLVIRSYLESLGLSVETAGQSSQGALLKLTGIVDGRGFRDAVLAQRDAVVATLTDAPAPAPAPVAGGDGDPAATALLVEIRDTLQQIPFVGDELDGMLPGLFSGLGDFASEEVGKTRGSDGDTGEHLARRGVRQRVLFGGFVRPQ